MGPRGPSASARCSECSATLHELRKRGRHTELNDGKEDSVINSVSSTAITTSTESCNANEKVSHTPLSSVAIKTHTSSWRAQVLAALAYIASVLGQVSKHDCHALVHCVMRLNARANPESGSPARRCDVPGSSEAPRCGKHHSDINNATPEALTCIVLPA